MNIKRLAALVLAGVLCLSAFTGCGVNNDEVIATLGKENISYGVANFMCKYQKALADDTYMELYGQDVWEMDLTSSGSTMEDQLKDSIMASLHNAYTLKAHMDDYNVALTEGEEKAIDEAVAAFIASNSKDALEEMSATEDVLKEVLTLFTIYEKMYAAIAAEADHEISDEEVNMRGYSIIEVELKGYYDGAYNYVEYTEEEAQARKAIAENIKKELATSDLETLAEKYDLEISTKAYAKNDESLDENILAALDKLAVGDTPAAVETEDAVYFVRIDTDCDKEATEENRLIIITERESVHFQEVLLGWQENDDWTVNEKVVAKIDFRNILTTKDGTEDSTQTEASESTETTESE